MPLANNSDAGQTSEFRWTMVVQAMGTKVARVLKPNTPTRRRACPLTIGNQVRKKLGRWAEVQTESAKPIFEKEIADSGEKNLLGFLKE